jgi:hypothetical protein
LAEEAWAAIVEQEPVMMKFGTTLKTIQIALALTALTPVPLFAESPVTAR